MFCLLVILSLHTLTSVFFGLRTCKYWLYKPLELFFSLIGVFFGYMNVFLAYPNVFVLDTYLTRYGDEIDVFVLRRTGQVPLVELS
jgi:hypothetical protein